jgi:creatinine amidohydrolase
MKKILWEQMCRNEFEELAKANAVVIVPVGSIEQHGNHLPVNTDINCCYAIAQRAAQSVSEFPVLVLPPIWMGYSPHHMPYRGAITLKHHTFVEVLTQVVACVHAHGFKKILILNGHGGNSGIVNSLRIKLAYEDGMPTVVHTYWEMPSVIEEMKKVSQTDKGDIGHAGEMETSLQLYLQADLVDIASAVKVPDIAGDPTTASREKGEYIVNAAVTALVKILHDYHGAGDDYATTYTPEYH